MKILPALLLFTFTLACHAQRWTAEISGPFDTLTNSAVYSDGVGGGAILIGPNGGTHFSTVVWFNSGGTMLLSNSHSPDPITVLRVRPNSLDLQTTITIPSEAPQIEVRHFTAARGEVHTLVFRRPGIENGGSETVASVATPQPDKRGYFTVQTSATNLLVRRYNFF